MADTQCDPLQKRWEIQQGLSGGGPGITIRDRLQALKPNYPGNYYQDRELIPQDMPGDMRRAIMDVYNRTGRNCLRQRGVPSMLVCEYQL